MAKHNKIEHRKHTVEHKKDAHGSEKVVETTKKEVVDNLEAGKTKTETKVVEKEEKTPIVVKEDNEKVIEEKKAKLINLAPAPLVEQKEVILEKDKVIKKTENKSSGKWDINPINRIRHIGTRALSGIAGLPSRVAAKLNHIYARPQQLVSGAFRKDLGKNIIKTPAAILTTISGAFYKPHRDRVKFEDNFKDYGPEFANPTDKSGVVRGLKKALWLGGKIAAPTLTAGVWSVFPKFFANIGRGMNHAIHETFEGIRDSKLSLNPKKWGFKFSKTKEAFLKAFSWNKKGIPASATKTTKVIDISAKKETVVTEEKKAA